MNDDGGSTADGCGCGDRGSSASLVINDRNVGTTKECMLSPRHRSKVVGCGDDDPDDDEVVVGD